MSHSSRELALNLKRFRIAAGTVVCPRDEMVVRIFSRGYKSDFSITK